MRVLPEIVNLHKLPEHVRTKLAQLELELSEGDITEKGYEKKRRVLLAPYVQAQQRKKKQKADAPASKEDTSTEANKQQGRSQRRLTRNESRYHSEIRKEAVQQALAAWGKRQNEFTPGDMCDASTPVTSQGDSLAEPNSDTTNAHPSTVVGSIRAPISRRPTSRSRSKGRKHRSLSKATAPVATNSDSSSSGSSSSEDEESTPHDSGTEQGDCSRKNKATKKAKKSKNSTSKDKQQANGKVPKDSVNGTSKSKHQPLTTSEIRIVDRNEKENVPSSPHPKAASSSPQTKSEKKKPKNGPGTPARTSSAKEVAEREEASKTRDSTSPKSKEKNENGTNDVKIRNKENSSPSTRSNCKSECAETASTSITRQITAGTSIIVVANNKEYEHKDIAAEPRPTLHSTRRLSPAVKRTSVLVLEDRPLPELPPDASDSEEQPEDDDLSAGQELSNDAVYINTRTPGPGRTSTNDSGIGGSSTAPQDYANANIPLKPTKVSQKIQQLLMTLQRPKKKALHEYYNDDDKELEALAVVVDPNAPKPEGSLVTPARGDFPNNAAGRHLQSMQNQPRSIDSILHRYGTTQPKAIAGTVLDHTGKPAASLTYGKLLSRATKVAYMLLTKQVTIITSGTKEKVHLCLPGDRVAIVYPNTEPLSFLTAFYGCLLAGVVPVPIEVPLTKRDAGIQQFGFLLGSCGVRVALTSEACLKGLPKTGQHSTSTATPASNVSMSAGVASPSSSLGPSTSFSSSTTGSGGSGHSANSCNNQNYYNHYAPSTNPNDVAEFKGWPRLHWVITENLPKPSRDWTLPSLLANDEHAYVEYATDREGSVKGVCVSRQSMMAHCRAIVAALGYKEGETIVSVLDFKRDVGLWHTVLAAIYNGMRVHFVPYSLMKINPTSWLAQVTKFQATAALVKSRDLHWSLMATRDHKDLELSSLRTIVVADGSNPWSLSSCDQFLATFQPMGLNPNVLCPCAGSPETGTVSIRRPPFPEQVNGSTSNGTTSCSSGRGILSMLALSHSVVRVDQENSLTSLTLQDAGQVIPGGIAIVVRPTGPAKLCKADEVGEIALHAPSTASCYFGLKGVSQQTFGMSPLGPDDRPLGPAHYVRSGLIGFLGPEGLVFVIGNKTSLMSVSGRQHSADDLIATVLAVEPMKFIYRGRIAVFSVRVLRDERICIVAEQKSDVSEEDSFNWMVRVLHAIDSIHQVGVYCLALVSPNQLPKTPLGGIHVTETRQRFLDGNLHPTTLLMCPQNCVLNLPKPRETHSIDVGPAAMFVGNIVQGVRIAGAQGRELTTAPDESIFLIDILRQRAVQTPDHVLFTLINAKGMEVDNFTCQQLLKKSERIGALLLDKGHLSVGDHVALIFPPGLELIAAFYGCLAAGLVPVCIRAPSALNLQASLITVRMVVDVSKSVALLSNSAVIKLLKSKEASHRVNTKAWPTILDIDDMPSSSVARRRNIFEQPKERRPSDTCYLDFSVSTTGQLAGIVITAMGASMQCKSLKVACELYPSRNVTLCLDPCCGLGFTLWCLSSVYSGHQSTLISPAEVEQNASVWLTTLSQHKVRDTFCSYSVMEMCVRELAPQILQLKEKGVNLSSLRTCMAVAEERPRVQLCNAFLKLFAPLGLSPKAVSTSFGTRVNTAICLQGASSPDPTTVYVDARALRNDRVTLVEKGSPHSIPLMESGKLLPGTKVVIANPETKGQCADSHLGEIWVASQYNAAGYYSIFGEETHLHTDHFTARLKTGDTKTVFARTGYLGFLRQTQSITADGELHDAVFVVGSLDETVMLRGMRYHPVDIETTVVRSHKRICESAVFTWTHLLVVVAETDAPEAEALDLVPAITSAVLEEHHLIVGVVMLVDANSPIPINSRGEKQRMHLRDSFLKDQLDPIYVAYNM